MNFNKAAVEIHFSLGIRDSAETRTVMTTSTAGKASVRRHALLTLEQLCRKELLSEKLILWCLVRAKGFFFFFPVI